MRYRNWDVLIFPSQSKIPQQEFKTSCHVVQDFETQLLRPKPSLLAIVTCFIPSLKSGEDFRISIHSWEKPEFSRHFRGLKSLEDTGYFEARLFIDGKEVSSKMFNENGPWPTVIDTSTDEHGHLKALEFPIFHQELLSQNYWNPVDDLGRLKLVISEGFNREDHIPSFERIQNVISFSFQHAPLNLLESTSIAWPNASMWQQLCSTGGLENSKDPCSRNSGEACEDGNYPSGPLSVTSPFSDNEEVTVMAKMPSNERQTDIHTHLGTMTTPFKAWHEKTSDLFMLDYLRQDSYNRTAPSGQMEGLPTDSTFERIFDSLLAAPTLNTHQDNETLVSDEDTTAPSHEILKNFEEHASSFPTLDLEMYDISKNDSVEFPGQLTAAELNSRARSDVLNGNETRSIPQIDQSSLERSLSITLVASSPKDDLDRQEHTQEPGDMSKVDC